jgi:hypothetical protein
VGGSSYLLPLNQVGLSKDAKPIELAPLQTDCGHAHTPLHLQQRRCQSPARAPQHPRHALCMDSHCPCAQLGERRALLRLLHACQLVIFDIRYILAFLPLTPLSSSRPLNPRRPRTCQTRDVAVSALASALCAAGVWFVFASNGQVCEPGTLSRVPGGKEGFPSRSVARSLPRARRSKSLRVLDSRSGVGDGSQLIVPTHTSRVEPRRPPKWQRRRTHSPSSGASRRPTAISYGSLFA